LDIAAYTTKAMDNRRLVLAVALFCQVWIAECELVGSRFGFIISAQ